MIFAQETLASTSRCGYAGNGQITVFSTVSIFWPFAMRRIRPGCCAYTASGHAAVLPSSVMNSRRFMGAYPKAKISD